MELLEVLKRRRSVRKFKMDKLSQGDIDTLMHAAMSGPSASNKQPWEFYVITEEAVLAKLRRATFYSNIIAPCAIVVCGDKRKALPFKLGEYWIQDCSAASENILLAATNMYLGSVWCGIYPQKDAIHRVRAALDLPESLVPLNIIYLGHPSEYPEGRDQYDEDRVHMIGD